MKKYLSTIILGLFLLPTIVFGQTESTVSKTITSYRGVDNVSDSKVIKKSSDSNSLNVLLQVGLINAGYNPGEPDGVVGPKTIQAIKKLQKDLGIKSDGVFGPATASALRMFSDRFTNQKVSDVKSVLPDEFADFKNKLKQNSKQVASNKNSFIGITNFQLPTTPKGVLTYVLSKNQPGAEGSNNNSSSFVGSLVASLTKKPKTNFGTSQSNTINITAGGNTITGSSEFNTNFEGSSDPANSKYTCVTTSEHTEECTNTSLSGGSSNSYYCRGPNCEVLGLTNKPGESTEEYMAPTEIDRSIDFNEMATFGEPVAFDKKTGQPIIFLKDYGDDPKNGKRNLSVIFVDLKK